MSGDEERTIRKALAAYDVRMGPLAPPDPAGIWQRMEFRKRHRLQPGLYVYRSACREAMAAAGVLVALIATSSWGWVGRSLLLELSGCLTIAVLLAILARRDMLLTLRD